ncbi:hypothetical protein PMAYCL1PPCAC_11900 [Pristionchus mayeri]|uniref:CX domain-containing protein n=1 Tax=Pristionchus mayeri TaxID=1317129 RepID=A0AAN5CDV5_9BILA|nr:hypothetical protein PMAYCL1PPCAC_11900 [Pristionchus mayeri]
MLLSLLLSLSLFGPISSIVSSTQPSFTTSQKRVNFSPKRAQQGSIDHTVSFREALFALSSPSSVLDQISPIRYTIRDPKTAFKFESIEYYWDWTYLDPSDAFPVVCSNPIEPSDPKLGKVFFVNGSRPFSPREIAWSCPPSHGCCGYECCKETSLGESMLRLILVLVLLALACFALLEFLRWCLGCCSRYKHVPSSPLHKRSTSSSSPRVV